VACVLRRREIPATKLDGDGGKTRSGSPCSPAMKEHLRTRAGSDSQPASSSGDLAMSPAWGKIGPLSRLSGEILGSYDEIRSFSVGGSKNGSYQEPSHRYGKPGSPPTKTTGLTNNAFASIAPSRSIETTAFAHVQALTSVPSFVQALTSVPSFAQALTSVPSFAQALTSVPSFAQALTSVPSFAQALTSPASFRSRRYPVGSKRVYLSYFSTRQIANPIGIPE
jgi:hypothetical protein